jgi:hypothetical protein
MNTTSIGAADISEFSVDIFKLNLSTKLQHDSMTLRMSARSERLYHTSNLNDIQTNGAPLTFVNRSELPTDQSNSKKIACFHGNKRLDQSEHWILTF